MIEEWKIEALRTLSDRYLAYLPSGQTFTFVVTFVEGARFGGMLPGFQRFYALTNDSGNQIWFAHVAHGAGKEVGAELLDGRGSPEQNQKAISGVFEVIDSYVSAVESREILDLFENDERYAWMGNPF